MIDKSHVPIVQQNSTKLAKDYNKILNQKFASKPEYSF